MLISRCISACDLRTKSNTSCHSSPQHSSSDSEQPCDLRLFTPTTCLRELSSSTLPASPNASVITPAATAFLADSLVAAAAAAASSTLSGDRSSPTSRKIQFGRVPIYRPDHETNTAPIMGGAYTCERCGNSYARPHSLNRHKRFECGVEPKFECPICRKKSKHKHNLVLHMRTHQPR